MKSSVKGFGVARRSAEALRVRQWLLSASGRQRMASAGLREVTPRTGGILLQASTSNFH